MSSLFQTVEAMERACESEGDLVAFTQPQLDALVAQVKTLDPVARAELEEKLARITTLIEGQMMVYAEELEKVGGQIRAISNTSLASNAYNTVAVIPIRSEDPTNH